MELQDKYKDGKTVIHVKGFRVNIINDPSRFQMYKDLNLDVFKKKRKKSDSANDSASE